MIGFYKDSNGENIFKDTTVANNPYISKDSEGKFSESEVLGLQRRIKELEDNNQVWNN